MNNVMWNQNTVHTIDLSLEQTLEQINPTKGLNPQMRTLAASIESSIEEMDRIRVRKIKLISFGLGNLFVVLFFTFVAYGQIRLSGPYMPMFLMLFHQRLEYVLRYQALAISPIAINAFIIFVRKFSLSEDPTDDMSERLNKPLQDSIPEFVMSTTIQMVLAANLDAQQVMKFCPFIAITFFFGRVIYLATYPKYHFFGTALSFIPSLIAILFNAYGTVRFIFY